MVWIAVAVVVLALVVFAVSRLRAESGVPAALLPYSKAPALFTPAERSFFGVLAQAAGKDFQVFGKVRVADVLNVNGGLKPSIRNGAFNRISAKHFDFVLCSPTDLSVLCVIELNDASHFQKKRQDRDDFLEAACKAARLPLVVFPVQAAYSPTELTKQISEALTIKDIAPSDRVAMVSRPQVQAQQDEPSAIGGSEEQTTPVCPKCSGPMIKRMAKGGENAGKEFWGCSQFPKCRGVLTA